MDEKKARELHEALQELAEQTPAKEATPPTRKPSVPTSRIRMSAGDPEPVNQRKTPWYESALFWGFLSPGAPSFAFFAKGGIPRC